MKVRVLGCHGGVAPGYQTSCYQINDSFLIDCGSVCSSLSPKEQAKITDIFITHPHLDHIKDICFVLENTFSPNRETLTLRSTKPVLDDIKNHLLNDVIWPDFARIPLNPKTGKPSVVYEPVDGSFDIAGVTVTPFEANHPGNAVGYLIDDGDMQIIFSGDTGENTTLWETANQCKNLKAIYSEISFPSNFADLARASGHYTLSHLKIDHKQLKQQNTPIYIAHFKPLFLKELLDEFQHDAPEQFILMHEDDSFEFTK